jgi:hypothetical protein
MPQCGGLLAHRGVTGNRPRRAQLMLRASPPGRRIGIPFANAFCAANGCIITFGHAGKA